MSELLDKQVYVQIENLKIIFQGSCKPMKKVRDENESKKKNDDHVISLWWKEEFIGLHQRLILMNFRIATLNEGTISLVMSKFEPARLMVYRV